MFEVSLALVSILALINTVAIYNIKKSMEATIKEETMFKIAVIENIKMINIKLNKKTKEELDKLN